MIDVIEERVQELNKDFGFGKYQTSNVAKGFLHYRYYNLGDISIEISNDKSYLLIGKWKDNKIYEEAKIPYSYGENVINEIFYSLVLFIKSVLPNE